MLKSLQDHSRALHASFIAMLETDTWQIKTGLAIDS